MIEYAPNSVVELFQQLVRSGEFTADLKITIHLGGGPGPQLKEEYILAGTGHASLSRRDLPYRIEQQAEIIIDQATCHELFEQVSLLLSGLSERPTSLIPDSLVGLLLIETGGQFARFIFVPQETRQEGKSVLVGSPVAAVVERFRAIIAT